jgi:hypothetical protein
MTINELVVAKTAAGGMMITSALTASLASTSSAVPLEAASLIALIGACIAYGQMRGEIKERQRATDDRFRRISNEQRWLRLAITRIAERQSVALSDLPLPEEE